MSRLPKFEHVTDVVAEDSWSYTTTDGTRKISRIIIGRPRPWPNDGQGDWVCPVQIEDFTGGARAIAGVGPVDALMNAIQLVKAFAAEIKSFTPRAHEYDGEKLSARGSKPAGRVSAKRARQRKKTER